MMLRRAGLAIVALTHLCGPSLSVTPNANPAATPVFGKSLAPVGYVHFCATVQDECKFSTNRPEKIQLDTDKWDQLTQINSYVNGRIKPESDDDLYHVAEFWTYPTTAGDCEDYVLLKKRYLVGMGLSPSDMLITVLLDEKGEGHAVLTVVTDKGDFIMDNRREEILRWDQTDYKFLKRQSQFDPRQWVSLRKQKAAQVLVGAK
jgi:predicted transglutaminase-like cysteine proteinase